MSCSYMIAAEQKARSTYDNILRLIKDPEICDPIRFLRQREIVHFQRFGEGLRLAKDRLAEKNNVYFTNPSFDRLGAAAGITHKGSRRPVDGGSSAPCAHQAHRIVVTRRVINYGLL